MILITLTLSRQIPITAWSMPAKKESYIGFFLNGSKFRTQSRSFIAGAFARQVKH
jgi:hypothetical protein